MWSDLRAEIEQARQRLQLSEQDFAPLPFTTDWTRLEERIHRAFCRLDHPTTRPRWLWEHLRAGAVGLVCEDEPHTLLTSLVDPEETVWLMLDETVNFGDKFWFYQGTPHAIRSILTECYYLDEVYLISRKYTWLLCVNHHDVVYGIGSPVQERLVARGAKPIT